MWRICSEAETDAMEASVHSLVMKDKVDESDVRVADDADGGGDDAVGLMEL